jgi:hypothetical protein
MEAQKNNSSHTSHTSHTKHFVQKQLSQLEMVDVLVAKVKVFKNVDIKTKEVENNLGKFYAITVHIKLDDISNGVFHSATLKTVSYSGRIVNIKCVFSDNDNLINDMKVNRDSVFQCFRDIAPDTITDISLENFKDQTDKDHLRIIASTVRGSSLIFVYKKLMEFVNIINEKYGKIITAPPNIQLLSKPIHTNSTSSTPLQITFQNNITNNQTNQNITNNQNIQNNELDYLYIEEQKLQKQLDNIRLLRKTKMNCEQETTKQNIISMNPNSFAAKVVQSLPKHI